MSVIYFINAKKAGGFRQPLLFSENLVVRLRIIIKNYYTRFDQRLGWLGGNVNQAQHRANELAIAGLLSSAYIQQVLFPIIKEALQLIREMKAEQDAIYAKLLKL